MDRYPECIQCDFASSPGNWEMTDCVGCADGYVFTDGGDTSCTSQCGAGSYGTATYGATAYLTSSACVSGCSANCHECIGSGASECISCNSGYYLDNSGATSYGSCTAKSGSGGT
jgi:hypothetical protein